MVIGNRLKELRESKELSGGIEKRTGLLRCYISRVENGHTVPSIETLEKMARALEVPVLSQVKNYLIGVGYEDMAERVGFEPTVEFLLHTLSKRAP